MRTTDYQQAKRQLKECAQEVKSSMFNVPPETIFQIEAGVIAGFPNLNKIATPGAVYQSNYLFNPQHAN